MGYMSGAMVPRTDPMDSQVCHQVNRHDGNSTMMWDVVVPYIRVKIEVSSHKGEDRQQISPPPQEEEGSGVSVIIDVHDMHRPSIPEQGHSLQILVIHQVPSQQRAKLREPLVHISEHMRH
jgi:hypothetical protein